jgi:hypothetical protein
MDERDLIRGVQTKLMVAFNFKSQFADDVEYGIKKQTIRQKRRCRPGDDLQLYTGQRTTKCRKLRDAVCRSTDEISIAMHTGSVCVRINGDLLHSDAARVIACADGFDSVTSFAEFFDKEYGLPFSGWLIRWDT